MKLELSDFLSVTRNSTFAEMGRYLNKGCGFRSTVLLKNGVEVEYDDDEARTLPIHTEIEGIYLGTIIEGADGDGISRALIRDPAKWDDAVEDLDGTSSSVWDLVNKEDFTDEDDMIQAELSASWTIAWDAS
jgi:hypothetical protein